MVLLLQQAGSCFMLFSLRPLREMSTLSTDIVLPDPACKACKALAKPAAQMVTSVAGGSANAAQCCCQRQHGSSCARRSVLELLPLHAREGQALPAWLLTGPGRGHAGSRGPEARWERTANSAAGCAATEWLSRGSSTCWPMLQEAASSAAQADAACFACTATGMFCFCDTLLTLAIGSLAAVLPAGHHSSSLRVIQCCMLRQHSH